MYGTSIIRYFFNLKIKKNINIEHQFNNNTGGIITGSFGYIVEDVDVIVRKGNNIDSICMEEKINVIK
jgi:hypothetical protein